MSLRPSALLLSALLLASPAFAATVSERSPFTQGHWYLPARAGSGFDIFNAGGQVALVWYTYDEAGRPIWYVAQGDQSTLGTKAWPLSREKWSDGHSSGTVVGSVRLNVRNAEAIDLDWQLGAKSGTWNLQPFIGSGVISEIDHTGHWYDPAHPGWGFTLTEQGDVLGGVIYTYDPQGEPTWIAGFERGIAPRIELFALSGSCPYCAYDPGVPHSAGFVALDFNGETAITVHSTLDVPMAAGVQLDGVHVAQLSRPASTRSADRRLAAFDDDAALKSYLSAGLMAIPAFAGVDFSPAPPTTSYSTTNLIEAGVDEADVVKSDGQRIYTYAYSNGIRQPVLRVADVAQDGSAVSVAGTVPLSVPANAGGVGSGGLYLDGRKLVSVTGPQAASLVGWMPNRAWAGGSTYVEVLDASGALPKTLWHARIDGYLVTSRRIGERVYVVSRFVPLLPGFVYGAGSTGTTAASNQALLDATPLASLLPQAQVNDAASSPLATSSAVYAPAQGARAPIADMILVTAIDLGGPRIAQSLAIAGSIDAVYASPTNLYVASSREALHTPTGGLLPVEPNPFITDIHEIALGPQGMEVAASGAVEGYLDTSADRAPFRMSEDQGRLRVVTGSQVMWNSTRNRLTILEPSAVAPGLLRTDSYLPNAIHPQPLGKANELLYGVRFVADRLYAVSFKRIDPIYIVDLSNAADPRIAGSLELPGFSEYLHPLPNGLLLGFGKDARPAPSLADGQFAWYQGLQLSLFDVRDPTTIKQLQQVVIGKRGSDSALLRDHHAFSMLDVSGASALLAFPASIHDGAPPFTFDDASYYYPWQESGLMRFELQGSTADDARLVQMPSLITQSAPIASGVYYPDPAVDSGRSILFAGHAIYVGNGQFWVQGDDGMANGPY